MKTYKATVFYESHVDITISAENEDQAFDILNNKIDFHDTLLTSVVTNLNVAATNLEEVGTQPTDDEIDDLVGEVLIELTSPILLDTSERNEFINSIFEDVKSDYMETADVDKLNPEDVRISLSRIMLNITRK